MVPPKREPITFAERVATAFISAIAAALTLFAYFIINAALAAKAPSGQIHVSSLFFSKLSAYIVGTASMVGFLSGSERMARIFSFFWGTHEIWEQQWFQRLFAVLLVVAIVALVAHFLHGSYA